MGTGDGQFSLPSGVAVDSTGDVYVADSGNSRIQKFDSSGNFITKWGTVGTGDGQFGPSATVPLDIAIGSSDNVVVVDPTNNRVEKFRPIGTFITKWGTAGSGTSQFTLPSGVAIASGGEVYVVDQGNSRVERFHETDATAPATSLDSGPSGISSARRQLHLLLRRVAAAGLGFECRFDTAEWESCGSPKAYSNLSEGSHTFRGAGGRRRREPRPEPRPFARGPWTTSRRRRRSTPAPPGRPTTPRPRSRSPPRSPGSSFECRLDSNQAADCQPCSSPQPYSSLADGAHTFEVRATDAVGNTDPTPASRSFTVDTTPPETTIDSGPSGTDQRRLARRSPSPPEAGASFECRLDSNQAADWQSCSSPKPYSSWPTATTPSRSGPPTRPATPTPRPASRSFTVDATPPTATAPVPRLLLGQTTTPVQVSWSGGDNHTTQANLKFDLRKRSYQGGAWGPWSSVLANTSLRAITTRLSPGTPVQYEVRSRDQVGNVSTYKVARSPMSRKESTAATYTRDLGHAVPKRCLRGHGQDLERGRCDRHVRLRGKERGRGHAPALDARLGEDLPRPRDHIWQLQDGRP